MPDTPTPESLSAAAACLLAFVQETERTGGHRDARQLREHYEAVTQAADWFAALPPEDALRPMEAIPGITYRSTARPGFTYRRTGYVLRCVETGAQDDICSMPDEPILVPAA